MKRFFYLLPAVILFVFACKKRDDHDFRRLNDEGYLPYRQGQYFIFKDSASGRLDSVVVTIAQKNTEWITEPIFDTKHTYEREYFEFTLSKMTGAQDSIWIQARAEAKPYGFRVTEGVNRTSCLDYPPSSLAVQFSSMLLEGVNYNAVIVWPENITLEQTYWWSKGVGLIKLRRNLSSNTTATFNLIRHS